MRLCGAALPPARWKPWPPLTLLPMSTTLALWICGTTPALPPDVANSGRPKKGTSSRSLVRIDRTGPTPAESVEWNTAARRVRLPSTGSSMTMSAWLRPAWGRARGWLSTFTNSAGRLIRPSKAPSTPVSGATGGGAAVVVVVGGGGVADVGDGCPAPASVPDGASDNVAGRGPAGERRRPVVPRGDPHVPRGQPGAGVRRRPGPGRSGRRARALRRAPALGTAPRRARLDVRRLAQGARRPGAVAPPAGRLFRGVRPRPRARPARHRRRGPARTDGHRLRLDRSAAPVPAADRGRRGAVVPVLLRARRRQRPGQTGDAGDARRRRLGDPRPEGVDVARPLGRLELRARTHRSRRRGAQAPRDLVPAGAHAAGRHRDPSDRAGDGRQRVRRGVLRRCPYRPRQRRRRRRRRLEDRDGHPRLRAGGVDARPAAQLPQRARRDHGRGPAQRRRRRPGRAPATRRCPHRPGDHARQRAAHAVGYGVGLARAGGHDRQALLVDVPPRARRAGHGRAGRRGHRPRRGRGGEPVVRSVAVPAAVPLSPRGHHPPGGPPQPTQQQPRGAARPAPGAPLEGASVEGDGKARCERPRPERAPAKQQERRAMSESGTAPKPPTEPGGHELLAGKVAVVTAAAGTGIGSATARRLLVEGATVVVSDAHPRRLAETTSELAEAAGGEPPLAVACDVTDEPQVRHLFDAALERHGRIDVVVNNAGLGGTADLVDMTDEQWHTVVDVTLTGTFRCTRAALRVLRDQGSGVIV